MEFATAKKICDLKNKIKIMSVEEVEKRLEYIDRFCIQYDVMLIVEVQFLADRCVELEIN